MLESEEGADPMIPGNGVTVAAEPRVVKAEKIVLAMRMSPPNTELCEG